MYSEFLEYQAEESLPHEVTEEKTAEQQWQMLVKQTDYNGCPRFKNLASVMLGILLIPVSNCACERIFSLVRRNKTDFRGAMGSETLSALMVLKSGHEEPCYSTQLSDGLLRTCKSATSKDLM